MVCSHGCPLLYAFAHDDKAARAHPESVCTPRFNIALFHELFPIVSFHSRYIYNPCYTPCHTPVASLRFEIKQTDHTGQSIALAIAKGEIFTVDR